MWRVFYQRGAERVFVDDLGEAGDAYEYLSEADAYIAAQALTFASRRSIGGDGRRYAVHGAQRPRRRPEKPRPRR